MEKEGRALRTATDEEAKRQAAALLGSIRTERKAAASRANGFKPGNDFGAGGRAPIPLLEIRCDCAVGESLEGHRWDCPRGRAIKRRRKEGRDVLTGRMPDES